jgi:hypothetical protein
MGSVSDCQANGNHQPPPPQAEAEQVVEDGVAVDRINDKYHPLELVAEAGQVVQEGDAGVTMEGVASIALLPTGAISGHFIRLPDSICYGLHGTRIHLSPFPLQQLLVPSKFHAWEKYCYVILISNGSHQCFFFNAQDEW